uniref:hypothetical protein n=1 Tax=Ciborinia camelliae TaxID=647257 RepID=UPI001FA71864|nr:hypothetical protein MRV96_mgp36 [Ciborinia camelliae]UNB14723.1 hypothetical protein [Ciborinia camelliae]
MNVKISRLTQARDYHKASTLFMKMLSHSKSLRVYAIYQFFRGWYYGKPYYQVIRVANRFHKFMITLPQFVTMKRRYIRRDSERGDHYEYLTWQCVYWTPCERNIYICQHKALAGTHSTRIP